MPANQRQLGLDHARELIAESGFAADAGTGLIGVELESFTVPAREPELLELPELPGGSAISFEPGGQVELSSRPSRSVAEVCKSVSADLGVLREALSRQGVDLVQRGVAPFPTRRLVDGPRYRAMEAYFDGGGPAGRAMMCGTASLQINVDLGRGPDRWRRANALGPTLAAAFSSSPPGCARLQTWLEVDPSRTAPVDGSSDPAAAWIEYALDARVMFIRAKPDDYVPMANGLTARQWITGGHSLGWPDADDVAYHLTTLFPPVRPRGWIELRMIDALPDPWWRVPVAVVMAVIESDLVASPVGDAASDRWRAAAVRGLDDPALASEAARCARAALDGLGRTGVDGMTAGLVEQWAAAVIAGRALPWT